MSTGAFLAILDRDAGLRGLLARSPGAWGPVQQLKCWRVPVSHGTVQLRLRKRFETRTHDFKTQQEVKNLTCRKSTGESGGIQAPGACGPGLQGPRARPTSSLGLFRKPPGGSLAKAWVSAETAASEVGTWRETKPGYPPYPPPPPPLRFGAVRDPTRPPRSADSKP